MTSITGDVSISCSFTLTVDVDGTSPQFTLTCISTSGPATTVTWTRDSTPVTEGNETVLQNPITAEYLHTLNVTGDIKGRYTCAVANNKPSNASETMECEGGCMHSCRYFSLLHKFSSDPGQPIIILVAKSATSLNLTWNVSNTTDVTYTVEWQKTGCSAENQDRNDSITTINTSYSIRGQEERSKYNITVSAGELSTTVSAVTIEKGQGNFGFCVIKVFSKFFL